MICLPAGEAPAGRTEAVTARRLGRRTRRAKILVIDDEREVGLLIADAMAASGHRVEVVTNPADGIERFKRDREFRVVVTDLGMPGLSGWDVAKAIRATRRRTGIILITGWGLRLSEQERREHQVDMVLDKPFKTEELREALSRVLGD